MGRFGYFLFLLLGEEELGSPGRQEVGGSFFFIENPGGVGGGERAGRVSAANWGILGGGGLNIFGAETSTKKVSFRRSFKNNLKK